jgi:hypothetical protein
MALTPEIHLREDIQENLDELLDSSYPEDLLNEMADGFVPVYYSDIIAEWMELPADFQDSWTQYGMDESFIHGGISRLMTIDLASYYQSEYHRIYRIIAEEIQEEEALAEQETN